MPEPVSFISFLENVAFLSLTGRALTSRINKPIDGSHKKTAPDNISNGDRDEICYEKLVPGNMGPVKNTQWNKKPINSVSDTRIWALSNPAWLTALTIL